MTKNDVSYNEAVAEIEGILRQIEEGRLDIDQLAEKVKRVTRLLETCRKKLRSTEKEIEKIMADLGEQQGGAEPGERTDSGEGIDTDQEE